MLICCSGMLRSGSAFQFNLVCSLLEKVGTCERHGRIDNEEEWLAHPHLANWAAESQTYHVVKSAIIPPQLDMARAGLARICYIRRDTRDVAVAAKYKWGLKGEGLLEMLDRAVKTYDTLEQADALGKPWLLHQAYENVFNNTSVAVWEIARFLEVTLTQQMVDQVVKECSLEAMETISKSKVLFFNRVTRNSLGRIATGMKRVLPPPLNGSWRLRRTILRVLPKNDQRTLIAYAHIEPTHGVPGAWRDVLDKTEQEVITTRYQDYLTRAGYIEEQR